MMNFTELAENAGLEKNEFMELMKIFLERTLSDIRRLQTSIDKGNPMGIIEAAHSIKGAAGNLCFDEIYQIAKDIEMKARENILNGIPDSVFLLRKKIEKFLKNSGHSDE
ncbi:MAG: Hpt domain-containing protein [Thermodesulfovibrionales bacterium]